MADPYGLFPSYRKQYRKKLKKRSKNPLAKRVRKLEFKTQGIEYKTLDTTIASAALTTTATGSGNTVINLIAQGDSNITREGDIIVITSVHIRLIFNADTAGDANMIRVMLVQDKQSNGAGADVDLVLTDTSAQDALVAPRETQGRQRFRVWCDKMVRINKEGEDFAYLNIYKKLNLKVNYGLANGGTIADIATNSLLLYVFGFNTQGTWQGITRCNFLDN